MKRFDIDKLERKTPYTVPTNFFEEVQNNVLSQTVHKIGNQPIEMPKHKELSFNMNWVYSAAAAIVAIFGVLFFINQSNGADNSQNNLATTKDSVQNLVLRSQEILASQPNQTLKASDEEVQQVYNEFKKDELNNTDKIIASNTLSVNNRTKNANASKVASIQVNSSPSNLKKASSNAEAKVDQILDVIPNAELAELSENTENDVYLDLYY